MTSSDHAAYIAARRLEIERALGAALPTPPDCPADLADAMKYSVLAGGKRLRPLLCLASCEAVGGDRTLALPAACALEFIHTYSLIHDDLPAMDNDTMRRGRPTLHMIAGEGMAILAGDGLLTEAFALLARSPTAADPQLPARSMRVIGIVARAAGAAGMVGGQAIDLASVAPGPHVPAPAPLEAQALQTMHAMKTGALIRAAATAGAVIGGASEDVIGCIDTAAAEFGLAFQIVDDILDVEGVSGDLGKTAGKDAAAGKSTYPAVFGLERSRALATACLTRAEDALSAANLQSSHLLALGRSMVERSR